MGEKYWASIYYLKTVRPIPTFSIKKTAAAWVSGSAFGELKRTAFAKLSQLNFGRPLYWHDRETNRFSADVEKDATEAYKGHVNFFISR